jgi:hypothetical protein
MQSHFLPFHLVQKDPSTELQYLDPDLDLVMVVYHRHSARAQVTAMAQFALIRIDKQR